MRAEGEPPLTATSHQGHAAPVFAGYRRADGTVGIRNYVLVLLSLIHI